MSSKKLSGGRVWRYLVPMFIGFGGLLFSRQIDGAFLRFSVILISVAVPLFAGGNLLGRYGGQRRVKVVLLTGIVMLLIGAAASLSEVAQTMAEQQVIPRSVAELSRWIGMFSLLLGSFAVLFSVARAGQAVEEIGERFRNLADLMSEGFILTSPSGTIVLVNQQLLDMMGVSEDMVVGENAGELVTRLGLGPMAEHLDLRAKALASEYEVTWHARGEDRQFWISGTPVFGTHGEQMGTLATVRDVTERNRMAKRLERYAKGLQELVEEQTQKLMQSEAEFRDLLMQMSEGFLTIDANYRIQFANQRICTLLKVDPQAVRGCEIFDFVDPAGRVRMMDMLRLSLSGVRPGPHPEFNFVRSDGAMIPVVVAAAPVQASEGAEIRHSLAITDVSELKLMQHQVEMRATELEAANEELRAFGRAKDGFLSNVSHELKTPLSTINGYVEMLSSGSLGALQAPQISALKVMERNVKRLVSLINEMIEFSRMEIRGIQLKKTLFNPGKLARECVASIQPQALAKDISVSIFAPDDFPPVWGDREKISQVLGILLSNAAKFSHEGGMIQVRVAELPERTLTFAVSDTGIGVDPAFHARVFEKFFQVDGSMTRQYEGTGIGLSIAKSMIEAHGGHIDLESELNRGSTFTVVLPGAVFDSTVSSQSAEGCENLKVLVVADGDSFRRAMQSVLTQSGCAAVEARNGYECVRLAEEAAPDVIIFNEILADPSGANAVGQLRQSPETSAIPIIGLSGEDASKAQGMAELLHEVHFVLKPFTADELMTHVKRVCLGEYTVPVPAIPAPTDTLSVLMVDADPDLFDWTTMALERRSVSCHGAKDAAEGIAYAKRYRPAVILIDLEAASLSAQHSLAAFRADEATRDIPICVISGSLPRDGAPPPGAVNALRKPFSIDDLMQLLEELRPTPAV